METDSSAEPRQGDTGLTIVPWLRSGSGRALQIELTFHDVKYLAVKMLIDIDTKEVKK